MDNNKDNSKNTKDTKGLHKDSQMVGLEINARPFRKWMKEHYERQSKSVCVINSHYIMATVNQVMTFSLLHGMSEYFKKNESGIYDISLDNMMTYVKLTPYLANTFHYCLSKYDDTLDYTKQLCINDKLFNNYITEYVFNNNFRMNLSKSSQNFLSYLLVQSNVMLSNTALIMTEFAKKSRVTNNAINSALKVHFSGKLYDEIMKKVDSVETLLKNKDKQDSEKGDSEKGDDDKNVKETNKKDDDEDDSDKESDNDEKEESESDNDEKKESESESESESDDEGKNIKGKVSKKIDVNLKSSEKPVKKQIKKK
jgi:hypothetical protein